MLEFIDHGGVDRGGEGEGYPELALDRRRTVLPGDIIDLGDVTLIVQSHGEGIAEPLGAGAPNPACEEADPGVKEPDENGMSVGYLLEFGRFQFVDLGDLTWGYEHELVCPVDKLGEVELFQLPHHGFESLHRSSLLPALNPLVVVIGNGPDKGNESATYERLLGVPLLESVWTIHLSEDNDVDHNPPDDRIANLEEGASDEAHFIRRRGAAERQVQRRELAQRPRRDLSSALERFALRAQFPASGRSGPPSYRPSQARPALDRSPALDSAPDVEAHLSGALRGRFKSATSAIE